jgi:hypothetical protein
MGAITSLYFLRALPFTVFKAGPYQLHHPTLEGAGFPDKEAEAPRSLCPDIRV